MRPYRQGDLDGLCGVYAILNGLRLLSESRARSSIHRKLFAELTRALPSGRLRAAMSDGLTAQDLVRAVASVFPRHEHPLVQGVGLQQPWRRRNYRTQEALLRDLREVSSRTDQAVIVHIVTPKFRHWSVVRSVSSSGIRLVDSTAMRELSPIQFHLEGRYRLEPQSTLLMRKT